MAENPNNAFTFLDWVALPGPRITKCSRGVRIGLTDNLYLLYEFGLVRSYTYLFDDCGDGHLAAEGVLCAAKDLTDLPLSRTHGLNSDQPATTSAEESDFSHLHLPRLELYRLLMQPEPVENSQPAHPRLLRLHHLLQLLNHRLVYLQLMLFPRLCHIRHLRYNFDFIWFTDNLLRSFLDLGRSWYTLY